jgi:murein L,D-transpeptidase YafK
MPSPAVTRALLLAAVLTPSLDSRAADAADACPAAGSRIVVEAARHRLRLCERGREIAVFDVRLGHGGVGKKAQGDGKTPLGTYGLGRPRPSKEYGVFIPVEYPTPEQRRRGYTGGAVGVHGPPREARWLGSFVNTFDSSDGCIGVATDDEIRRISTWVAKARARTIEIR